jgi:hypothetical protein
MDEIELFAIGAVTAVALATTEARVREVGMRTLLGLAVLSALAGVLYLLRLSVVHDPMDFLSADGGVILIVGACGVGGLLPPSLLDT